MKKRADKVILGRDAEKLISRYASIPDSKLVKTLKEAESFSKKIKFPLVLKIISEKAIHKTEINGIRIVKTEKDLEKSFEELTKIANKKKIKPVNILVQEFVEGKELIIGLKKDSTFGHVILFGIGGIFVELLKDVSFRVCPITEQDADSMINELKMKNLLLGYRNEKPANINLVKETLVKLSKLPSKVDIKELDINPFIINNKDGKAVDVRIVL